MSEHRAADEVDSGGDYVVTSVNGRPPESLDEFTADEPILITVASDRQTVEIRGSARREDDSVVVYEKSDDGTGKDVRTWDVHRGDGHFLAATRSLY